LPQSGKPAVVMKGTIPIMRCRSSHPMHLATAAGAALTIALAVGLGGTAAGQSASAAWSPEFVQQVLADARDQGDARRGAGVFSAATTGCTSCHKVAGEGGAVGPELTTVARCLSPEEIKDSPAIGTSASIARLMSGS
jgi:mono/diheme cytochrome c family protein